MVKTGDRKSTRLNSSHRTLTLFPYTTLFRSRDSVAVGLGGADDRVDVPRGVHDRRLVRVRIAEQIDVVLHRAELELLEVDRKLHRGRPCIPRDWPWSRQEIGRAHV